MPVRWPEPFGLVMAEAMATGTPVVAYRSGSAPEVVEDGVTGFMCDSPEEGDGGCVRLAGGEGEEKVLALRRVEELDRAACRALVEQRFSATRMAQGYEAVYE